MIKLKEHLKGIAISVAAVYPLLVLALLFVAPLLEQLNFYIRTLILVLLLVSLMRFVTVPIITKIVNKLK